MRVMVVSTTVVTPPSVVSVRLGMVFGGRVMSCSSVTSPSTVVVCFPCMVNSWLKYGMAT